MPLKAPRFHHHPVLEACLAGTHRMLAGERSAGSVLLVQQALIDSGYTLPKFGPDGKYGDETAKAVSKFKADRKIKPSDGVVGPQTMAALDDKFKDEPQPLPPRALGVGEMEVEDYMLAVKDAEAGFRSDSSEQLLTRIRQMYYPGTNPVGLTIRETAFDQLMLNSPIREANGTRRLITFSHVGATAFSRLTASAFENNAPPQPPDNPGPYIVDADGHRVDVGHVLLTIDALVHTTTGPPYTTYGVPGIDPASWVADIGSAAVWAERDAPDPPRVLPKLSSGDADLPGYFKMSAPDPDLFGDIDGWCILELWKSKGGSLSDILTSYYLSDADHGFHRRIRTFVGDTFGNPDPKGPNPFPGAARAFWVRRVNRFCDLFAAGSGSLTASNPPRGQWVFAEQVFDRFLSGLYTEYQKETALHP
jgi:Putative peptidoglycan binding domain